jgi:hypothetical protein
MVVRTVTAHSPQLRFQEYSGCAGSLSSSLAPRGTVRGERIEHARECSNPFLYIGDCRALPKPTLLTGINSNQPKSHVHE